MNMTLASFEISRLSGASLRFFIRDLIDIDGDPVVAPDTKVLSLCDDAGTEITAGTVLQDPADTNTFYADMTLPTVTRRRRYTLKASSSKNSHNFRAIGYIWVDPF